MGRIEENLTNRSKIQTIETCKYKHSSSLTEPLIRSITLVIVFVHLRPQGDLKLLSQQGI